MLFSCVLTREHDFPSASKIFLPPRQQVDPFWQTLLLAYQAAIILFFPLKEAQLGSDLEQQCTQLVGSSWSQPIMVIPCSFVNNWYQALWATQLWLIGPKRKSSGENIFHADKSWECPHPFSRWNIVMWGCVLYEALAAILHHEGLYHRHTDCGGLGWWKALVSFGE